MFRSKRLVNLLAELFGFPRRFDHSMVEIEYNCPHCDHNRNKFNMVVNTDNHVFHCWACSYKGKVDRLFWDFGDDRQKREWKKMDSISLNITLSPKTSPDPLVLTGFRSLRMNWSDSLVYKAAMRYLRNRNIGPNLISKWDICYAEDGSYKNRVIVPSRNLDGKMEYFIARDIFDTQKLKYKNPKSEKASIIFGEKFIDWKKPVIITEGVFDAMVLYNSVPLLGSRIEGHKRLLRKIFDNKTPIILGFDEDETGRRSAVYVGKYLLNLGVDVHTIVGNNYDDLSSAYEKAGKEYIIGLIRNAQPFDELDMVINTLRS